MNDRELGWVMGLIDGEGSIMLTPSGGRRSPRIMLPSTDIAPLIRLRSLVGGSICARADKRVHVDWAWTWVLSATRMLELLEKGWDLLQVPQKRNRAKFLLDHWKWGVSVDKKHDLAEQFFAIPDEKLSRKNTSLSQAKEALEMYNG